MSALSALLQPLEQAVEQAATPATASAETSHHNDDPPASEGEKIVNAARRALGLPYIWGGGNAAGPTGGGFDCSGLVQYSVAQATNGQLILPRTTYEQINCGRLTDLADARPGDLVFSNFSAPGVPEHVQIYAGQGRVIEAQQSGVPIKVSPLPAGQVIIKRVI
ncbi:C40 family peptidase [Mycobacterium avium]|nr:C40 family peptidase [Mycobacterium avium]